MDVTADTTALAAAAAEVTKVLPSRSGGSAGARVLLEASGTELTLTGSEPDQLLRTSGSAMVHTDGSVLVPARVLADTLRSFDDPQVRLAVEGSRLAVRAQRGRFALPVLDPATEPERVECPPAAGSVPAAEFASLLRTVAGAAAKDDALPMFTGVRFNAVEDQLRLIACDRFRMAIGTLPWAGEPLDSAVPAALLRDFAGSMANKGARVALHAGPNRLGFGWGGSTLVTAVLDAGFLDDARIVTDTVDTSVEVCADELSGAIRRVGTFLDPRGALQVSVDDGELRVSAASEYAGEAAETLKATVHGGRTSPRFQARYLAEAVRPFSGGRIRLDIQPGLRATVLTPAAESTEDTPTGLRYLVMPLRQ
ncbi:DNA polymerase-3 subunit beta [Tamaricihabitans halophyticus]|uniref:DNA polymerase-3 subunit beta n=1 Tax=Tamaricihabitans halophyticus TaxID=1262583 RepID=A0A4R2R4N1_9PSEU|nr:DNA polymerase III subunit beta [Tamaricihabitans halophyticus]TCP56874.1 DNA polymerase-3 subunit beta [Tamaricihabitans halophyticus]